jgi:hypothetical protein
MNKESVEDFSSCEISVKYSSAATVHNFFYIRSRKKKMGVVHHKKHSTKNNYIDISKKALQNPVNSVESPHVHKHRDGDQ